MPLLPLWAVRPVQSLSACTRVNLYRYLYKVDQIKNDELRQECSTHDMVEKFIKYFTRQTWCEERRSRDDIKLIHQGQNVSSGCLQNTLQ